MFENARLKLTAWYLAIIMAISIVFSCAIYSEINNELQRFERVQMRFQEEIQDGRIVPHHTIRFGSPDPQVLQAARARLIVTLGLINLWILGIAGGAGYFLAGRTLKPIKKMVDEQKRFITDASHELRTPLTALRSEIEVALRKKDFSSKDTKALLESNLEEVISLQTLSDNLLELAQNGKKTDPKTLQKISLSSLIDGACKKIEPIACKKQLVIQKQVSEISLYGIEERLMQVLVILLDNAIKYSIPKNTVYITTKQVGNKIKINIIDNGIGIPKADLPYVFDRFYRGDKSRSKISGYGLGLSIAKKIVESHRGTITVSSVLGKKTTFSLLLPKSS